MKLARVFPRRTHGTPRDELSFVGYPGLFVPDVDEVHVSCTFTWDLALAEELASAWSVIGLVRLGGPGTGASGGEFEPGLYLREGYTITSRGCPNACPFCYVPFREGGVRELPIRDGWNVQDDNLLACSDEHVRAVFGMLRRQAHAIEFSGGFEARRLKGWHVDELLRLRLKQVFFSYDMPADFEPLMEAAGMLREAGLLRRGSHAVRCYVLIGYDGDTQEAAAGRCQRVLDLGIMPMAMLFRDDSGRVEPSWRRLQREWANPVILGSKMRDAG